MTLGVFFACLLPVLILSDVGLHGSGVLFGGTSYGIVEITVTFEPISHTHVRNVKLCVPKRLQWVENPHSVYFV